MLKLSRVFLLLLFITFVICFVLFLLLLKVKNERDNLLILVENTNSNNIQKIDGEKNEFVAVNSINKLTTFRAISQPSDHHLGIIVPFRDRHEELFEFIPHLSVFLNSQKIAFTIWVINQVDTLRFNRGALLNIGAQFATNKLSFGTPMSSSEVFFKYFKVLSPTSEKQQQEQVNSYYRELLQAQLLRQPFPQSTYLALHDVDLLPLHPSLSYAYPTTENSVFHVSAPHLHPLYHYPAFIGGILLITKAHFEQVNGLSNNFWGWGKEDDDLYRRLQEKGISIARPDRLKISTQRAFKHLHDEVKRKRDKVKQEGQQEFINNNLINNNNENSDSKHKKSGVNNTSYRVVSTRLLSVQGFQAFMVDVVLLCDKTLTPWCEVR